MKKLLAVLLSVVMVLSMQPITGIVTLADGTTNAEVEYISLPITIRDYAADGMLFEWNELGATGDQTIGASIVQPIVKYTAKAGGGASTYTATEGDGYVRYTVINTGAYITYAVNGSNTRTAMRYAVLKYRTNAASAASADLPTIGHRWNNGASKNYVNLPQDGYNQTDFKSVIVDLGTGTDTVSYVTIYPRLSAGTYMDIAELSFFSSLTDATNYVNGTAIGGDVYHHGSTKGYGLLQTNAKDHFNDLADAAAISGTTLTQNGTWNSPDVTTSTATLNSGAKQTLYGCYVRTNLVEPLLGADKKPVYTEATVTYLAQYMQKTLPEVWRNNNGSYNMWYVMGTKLFDNDNNYVGNNSSATRDLAGVFRACIDSGLGTYAESKAKTLSEAKDCRTYFDAACFLLQSLFSDNSGYGQTVTEYHQINLVKKGNAYVYNSAYDGSVYDTTNGIIYNSQTDTITTRAGTTYVRGNLQAETRFDPIGALGSGAYYGNNGNKYLEAIDPNQNDITHYYNKTNYNLTLEGHAQFIFYEDDNLYFNFTGDDDVYLYINGVRVMDMGGAHSISKCGISLNDVKDLCGLKDGEVYDFDFYYMERHGTAANFGIETNIKIADPSMLTEKHAFQDGTEVGNYGYVDPNKAVQYQFKLTNNGNAGIQQLTFKDSDIGVSLSQDQILLNSETAITDLSVGVTDASGATKAAYLAGQVTEDILKNLLKYGLAVGDTITISGFKYTIPSAKWSNDSYTNTVNTTAVCGRTLNGLASCTVQRQEFIYESLHYYEWMGKGVTATNDELIEVITKAGVKDPGDNIQLCGPNGKTDSTAINTNAQRTADGITYTGVKTGSDTYYYKVGEYGPVAVTVYSYDVADNIYVLDYSLPVELNGAGHGLTANDTLTLSENSYKTTASTLGIVEGSRNEKYGQFAYGTDTDPSSLKYSMSTFMNGEDSVQIMVQVLEDGADAVTTKTGVVMTETVKVVPANVVYYEEDLPGITYINTDVNGWAHYRTDDSEGNEQSADQESPYGSDPNYQLDKSTEYSDRSGLTENEELPLAILGDSSNGSISVLYLKETADVLSFTFHGTGFEILSRTTCEMYAVVSVTVERDNGEGTYEVVKQFPVITESKGGDLYQIPIISVTGLEQDNYRVTLKASGSMAKTRILFFDGVRIYQPLDEEKAKAYYNSDEAGAEFYEIKTLIGDGKAVYADISDTGDEMTLKTGMTFIEGPSLGYDELLVGTEDPSEYLKLGPNNELYLDGYSCNTFLALYLTPDENVAASDRTIEIGAHRKADYTFDNPDAVNLVYGSTADAVINGTNMYSVGSGTEQYFVIDVSKLVWDDANNRYLLLVGTNDMENIYAALALTNLKISGYTVEPLEQEMVNAASGDPVSSALFSEFRSMSAYFRAQAPQEPSEEPAINDALTIESVALKADRIASGKIATLTVKVSAVADSLEVLDENGTPVEFKKIASNTRNEVITFQAMWAVSGDSGDVLNYTVVAYDADGLRSANTESIEIVIK